MSRRFQFEIPTLKQARDFLAERKKAIRGDKQRAAFVMAESYHDALTCQRVVDLADQQEEPR